jgi:hypothetical protein
MCESVPDYLRILLPLRTMIATTPWLYLVKKVRASSRSAHLRQNGHRVRHKYGHHHCVVKGELRMPSSAPTKLRTRAWQSTLTFPVEWLVVVLGWRPTGTQRPAQLWAAGLGLHVDWDGDRARRLLLLLDVDGGRGHRPSLLRVGAIDVTVSG